MIVPLPTMLTRPIDELLKLGKEVKDAQTSAYFSGEVAKDADVLRDTFSLTGISDSQFHAQSGHRRNWATLVLMHKKGFFVRPWYEFRPPFCGLEPFTNRYRIWRSGLLTWKPISLIQFATSRACRSNMAPLVLYFRGPRAGMRRATRIRSTYHASLPISITAMQLS